MLNIDEIICTLGQEGARRRDGLKISITAKSFAPSVILRRIKLRM